MKIINFKKKEMKLLKNEQQKSYKNAKICYICKVKYEDKHVKDERYFKFRDHCHYLMKYRGPAHSISSLKYSVPKEIPIIFCNGSNYGYHFIIKELAEEFENQFTYTKYRKIYNLLSSNRKRGYKN